MESVYNFSNTEILAFALVLLRLTGFVVALPIIGTAQVPSSVKVLFALMLTFVIFPQIAWKKTNLDVESLTIVTLAIKELFVGLVFGSLARLFFQAVAMAGQIMSVSLGISAAQLFNPAIGEVTTAFDQFFIILASLFFFAMDGHHLMISGIFDSYQLIPLQKTAVQLTPLGHLGELLQTTAVVALKMSAPILVSILFMNVAIAVVGKAVPQINILITSLPINILAGLMIIVVTLPLLIWQMTDLMDLTTTELFKFIKAM